MNFLKKIFSAHQTATNSDPGSSDPSRWRWGVGASASKIVVDESNALTYSAVFACVRIISETIASLPWGVYKRDGDNRMRMTDHPLDRILRIRPNDDMPAAVFRETLLASTLISGNGYAEIERARNGTILALWPIESKRVQPKRDVNGNIYYEIDQGNGTKINLSPDKIFHLRGLGYDGLRGYSPIKLAKESIGLGLAMEKFGASLFGNGTRVSGVLEHPQKLSEPAHKRLKESWDQAYSGIDNAMKVAILEEGMKFSQTSIAPDEAQFLESRRFQINEVCRWYRVPPHKLADLEKATFSNIEHQSQEFVSDTLVPWITRIEQEAEFKLFDPETEGDYFTKINLKGLLRGDLAARTTHYQSMLEHGVYDIDEVRNLEDMNSLPGNAGKTRMIPLNLQLLENAGKADNGNQGAGNGA